MKGDIPMNEEQYNTLLKELKEMHNTIAWISIWTFFISIFFIGALILIILNIESFSYFINTINKLF